MSTAGYRLSDVAAKTADDVDGAATIEVCVGVEDLATGRPMSGSARLSFGNGPEDLAAAGQAAAFVTAAAGSLAGHHGRSLGALDAVIGRLAGTEEPESPAARGAFGVSVAVARALGGTGGRPRRRVLHALGPALGPALGFGFGLARVPMPRVDIVRGGRRAANRLDFAAFSILPIAAGSFADALRAAAEVYEAFDAVLNRASFRVTRDHDGTYVPPLQAPGDVLDLLCDSIAAAGYEPGPRGVAISVGVAATSLVQADGAYRVNGASFDTVEMVEYLAHLVARYPVTSLEAPVARDDTKGWRLAAERLGDRVALVAPAAGSTRVPMGRASDGELGRHFPPAVTLELGRARTVSELVETARRWHARGIGIVLSVRAGGVDARLAAEAAVVIGCNQIGGAPPRTGGLSVVFDDLAALDARTRIAGEALPYARGGR